MATATAARSTRPSTTGVRGAIPHRIRTHNGSRSRTADTRRRALDVPAGISPTISDRGTGGADAGGGVSGGSSTAAGRTSLAGAEASAMSASARRRAAADARAVRPRTDRRPPWRGPGRAPGRTPARPLGRVPDPRRARAGAADMDEGEGEGSEESDADAEVNGASGADAREDRRAMPHDVRHLRRNPLSSSDSCGQPGSCGQLGHSTE
ncbi:hypothetical protein GCM10027028_22670 [Streptomyces sundarbansensis]